MKILCRDWESKTNENLFYQDLRSTLDGVEAGCIKKSLVNQLCRKNGYSFDWKDYSLKKRG